MLILLVRTRRCVPTLDVSPTYTRRLSIHFEDGADSLNSSEAIFCFGQSRPPLIEHELPGLLPSLLDRLVRQGAALAELHVPLIEQCVGLQLSWRSLQRERCFISGTSDSTVATHATVLNYIC